MELYVLQKQNPTKHQVPPFVRVVPVSKGSKEYEQIVLDNLSFAYVQDYGYIGKQLKADELVTDATRATFHQTLIADAGTSENDDWEEIVRSRLRSNPPENHDDLEMWVWTWTEEARCKVEKRLNRRLLSTKRVFWNLKTSEWERISDSRYLMTPEDGMYHGKSMTVDGVTFPVYHYFRASDEEGESQSNTMLFFGSREDMPSIKTIEGNPAFDSIGGGDITSLIKGDEEFDALQRLAQLGQANGEWYNRYWREPNGEDTFPDFLVEVNGQPVFLEITMIMAEMGPKHTYGTHQEEFPEGSGNLREIIENQVARKVGRLKSNVSQGAPHYLALIDVYGVLEPDFEIWGQTRLDEFDRSFLVSPLRNDVFEL